jgi:hypothetical protein
MSLHPGRFLLPLLAAASLVAPGCDVPVQPLGDTLDTVRVETSEPLQTNAIDILMLIDNSGSMLPFQAELVNRFEELARTLAGLNADFHIGVITTDGRNENQNGRLLDRPYVCRPSQAPPALAYCNDLNLQQPFLTASRYLRPDRTLDVQRFVDEFRCIASQGACGDSYEVGIDVIRRALRRGDNGLLDTANRGFIRDDAYLAIIMLTDEDDCSSQGRITLRQDDDCYTGDNRPLMTPVQDVFDELVALKGGDTTRLLAAAIMGPDDGIPLIPGTPPPQIPACTPALASAPVEGRLPAARDGERYREFLGFFGRNAVEQSICADSFTPALRVIGNVIRDNLDVNCLTSPPEVCRSNADCADGIACLPAGQETRQRFCADFEVQLAVSSAAEPFNFRTLNSPGPVGNSAPSPDAQFEVNFDAIACPTGVAFSFSEGQRPLPGSRFRATYPILISATPASFLPGTGDGEGQTAR